MAYSLPDKEDDFSKYEEPRLHLEKLLSAHLIEFDLPVRIVFPLVEHGVKRLGDLVACTPHDLMKIPNIGATSIKKISAFITHQGLYFGMKQGQS